MTTTTIAVPRDVPDGYALVKHEAIEYLADQWPGAYQKFYAIAVDSAPAAPTVMAEQVQCYTCHGQGEICVGQQTFGYMSMQPPEPIMEVCPECGGEEAPSLPAAGSAELIAEAERCLFVLREIGSMDVDDITGDDVDLRFEDEEGCDTGCDVSIVDYAEKSADVIEKMIAALSAQQSAPERVSVPVERIQIALEAVQNAMEDAYNNAYQNCCGRGNGQCCGDPEPAWSDADQAIMDALAPAQRELSALLNGGEA